LSVATASDQNTQSCLGTQAARKLATTTKTPPQMQAVSPRWLLRILPWVDVAGGTYRLTRTTRRAIERRGSDQPAVVTSAGHVGEVTLPSMFVDYETPAREYPLSAAQTVLRVHTRVDELYSDPMSQYEQQLRLTVEALRERQEYELLNDPGFGLLHNTAPRHSIRTLSGPPTPADLDNLIAKQTRPRYLLAHPRAIAAFARRCNLAGLRPGTAAVGEERRPVLSWRGVPLLPCDKLPISPDQETTILVLRPGEDRQGVIGLRPAGLPDQHEPGVSVRRLGIDGQAVTSYLVSAYYSVVMPVPNCVCALTGVSLG
jgi:hypothetical protein